MKSGFTLLEMALVLAILAVLTHLAVREMGNVRAARSAERAAAQLAEIQEAVWHVRPGEAPAGFRADTGRLPYACVVTNEAGTVRRAPDGREVLALDELLHRPADMPAHALRPALAEHLAVPAAEKAALADGTVRIPCGWRGPYLRLPIGKDRLLDAWNNPLENPDDAGYARLLTHEGAAASAGAEVARVRHLGEDGRPDDRVTPVEAAARDGEVELVPGGTRAALDVTVNFLHDGHAGNYTGPLACRWYAPCGGAITGALQRLSVTAGAVQTFSFPDLPAGVCTLTLKLGLEASAPTVVLRRLALRPGGNVLECEVPIP